MLWGADGEAITVYFVPGPALEQSWLLTYALGAALLALAAGLAWHRFRHAPAGAARPRRVLWAALAFGGALAVMRLPSHSDTVEMTLGSPLLLAVFALLGGALIGTAELLLASLRPQRTLAWLAAGPATIAAFAAGLLAATDWIALVAVEAEPRLPMLALAALTGGLVWWSLLPRPGSEIAQVFD